MGASTGAGVEGTNGVVGLLLGVGTDGVCIAGVAILNPDIVVCAVSGRERGERKRKKALWLSINRSKKFWVVRTGALYIPFTRWLCRQRSTNDAFLSDDGELVVFFLFLSFTL